MNLARKAIYCNEVAQRVKEEYVKLLSISKQNDEAERLAVDYFINWLDGDANGEAYMWLGLALCEWELGRLSLRVKERAMYWTARAGETIGADAGNALRELLNSPMPKQKKIPFPKYVSHCPWPVGSLLAYRIISSERPFVTESKFYRNYVLLRIIKIKRNPVSLLAPNDAWNEEMLVGLYDWIGESLPGPQAADGLEFTAISKEKSPLGALLNRCHGAGDGLVNCSAAAWQGLIQADPVRIETCCSLDWKCAKGINPMEVFTYLGVDPQFQEEVSPYFKTDITSYSLCHSVPFDAKLVKRFTQLER